MRPYVVSVLTSLDGFYEGPDHQLLGMPFEDAFNDHNLRLLREAGTMVYGGTWFENNLRHWSAVAADDASNDRDREIAAIVTSIDNLVVSDSLSVADDAPWAATTRVVKRADAPAEIARLKEGDGGHLLSFASSTTWNPLFDQGLVDELVVLVGAGLVGTGSPIYTGSPTGLRLLDAQVLDGSSLVAIRYDATQAGRPSATAGGREEES